MPFWKMTGMDGGVFRGRADIVLICCKSAGIRFGTNTEERRNEWGRTVMCAE